MKPHSPDITLAPSKLIVHSQSHTIFKPKPKIRIIHIVAPEIIKTDVKHFRDLVQRLTGKPAERKGKKGKMSSSQMLPPKSCKLKKSVESTNIATLQNTHRMKKENEEIFGGGNPNPNQFLTFFGDVDGFIQDANEYPLLAFRSSQINAFGEMPLC